MTSPKSEQPAGRCPVEKRLIDAWLEDASSPEGRVFLAHAASCRVCGRRLELANELNEATAPLLNLLPESAPARADVRALRRAARTVGKPFSRRKGRTTAAPSPILTGIIAAAAVGLAAAVILVAPPSRHEIFRGQTAALEEKMSPRGVLGAPPQEFRWAPVPGAARYSVELIDDKLDLLLSERNLDGLRVLLPGEIRSGLVRGKTYVWTVIALDEHYAVIEEISASFRLE